MSEAHEMTLEILGRSKVKTIISLHCDTEIRTLSNTYGIAYKDFYALRWTELNVV